MQQKRPYFFFFPFSQNGTSNLRRTRDELITRHTTRITANLQEMHKRYEIENWPAFKDLALSCQILTIRQIESYNRLLKKSTSIDMTNQVQLNLESSNENLVKLKKR